MQLKNKVCLKKKKKIYTYDQLVTLHWRKLRAGIHQGKDEFIWRGHTRVPLLAPAGGGNPIWGQKVVEKPGEKFRVRLKC